jgi:hypothetical protein
MWPTNHRLRSRRMGERAGVLLDLVLVVGLVLLGAFVLDLVGVSFANILQGAEHFFGF